MTLMGMGIGAVVVIWLIFSVVKKVFGIVLVIGLAGGAWILWSNPSLVAPIITYVQQFIGQR